MYMCMRTSICKRLGEDVKCPPPCSLLIPLRELLHSAWSSGFLIQTCSQTTPLIVPSPLPPALELLTHEGMCQWDTVGEHKSNEFVVQWSWTLRVVLLIPRLPHHWNQHCYVDERNWGGEAAGPCAFLMALEHEAFDLKKFFKNSCSVLKKTPINGPLITSVFKTHSDAC